MKYHNMTNNKDSTNEIIRNGFSPVTRSGIELMHILPINKQKQCQQCLELSAG